MAIEIVPEKKEVSSKENIVLIFSVVVLLVCFGLYFYFSQFVLSQKKAETVKLSAELTSLGQEDIKPKEDELALAGKYIGDFKILLENNPKASPLFADFQKWSQPKIVYSNFTFDIPSRKITMAGKTGGFQNIMQQIAILDKETTIESYSISNVELSEGGGVNFNLEVVLKPELFK